MTGFDEARQASEAGRMIAAVIEKYGLEAVAEARLLIQSEQPSEERVVKMMERFGGNWHGVEAAILATSSP